MLLLTKPVTAGIMDYLGQRMQFEFEYISKLLFKTSMKSYLDHENNYHAATLATSDVNSDDFGHLGHLGYSASSR